MQILPIFAALRRHKLVMWLLILEIALTCAIVCNSMFLIAQNLQRMHMPSGIAEHELVQIQMAYIGTRPDSGARTQADLAALRQIPGVTQVALVDKLPFGSGNNSNIKLKPDQPQPSMNAGLYFGENLLPTFGVKLIAGRSFAPEEFVTLDQALQGINDNSPNDLPHVAIVTQAMAQRLWPVQNALGKTFYIGKDIPLRVVGVLARLTRPNTLQAGPAFSFVVPISENLSDGGGSYVVRSKPQDRARVLRDAVAKLKAIDPNRVVLAHRTYDEARAAFFQADQSMAGTLVGVCVVLLVVTALGIGGLASFWVAQRRKQIGIRRAIGATRGDILRYFQTENFLIVSFGIAIGMLLAFVLNAVLMKFYELPHLPLYYLPIGALALWGLGQLAVLGPALRAAAVPPVVATRSV
ncbi:putative ABC transport system permease protein [Rhodanobacter glycinis]|jgi:putative ABC transport system permease protein|uniref:Putative ABC transport system permease protein n=2 Tax=Rhodanobacter glycinis TaxID=582702 RepID=A0A1I4A963_9GAMM|nr:FtsX-like permease family protein [Rhodanobacter glycinis]SFK52501.1 putative ABC transport system permease protein [Rhodanobacter glycinis]